MESPPFKFKLFEVSHCRSAMKVGVDAVLIGCWADVPFEGKILEVGTGCGVISLILAQRFPQAQILATDIDEESIIEADENFLRSPFATRLRAIVNEFPKDLHRLNPSYDLIISNPPFFNSGVNQPLSRREIARHQASLSPFSLIDHSPLLLKPGGLLSFIIPSDLRRRAELAAKNKGLELRRVCYVKNNERRPEKRVMMEFIFESSTIEVPEETHLTLFENNQPSLPYQLLCRDFYLKF